MSLVLLAILVVIWASILVPLLRRDHGNWPGGRRPVVPHGTAAGGRGGRAVWRPAPESLEEAEVSVPDLTVVLPLPHRADRPLVPWVGAPHPAFAADPDEAGHGFGPAGAGRGRRPASGRDRPTRRRRRAAFRRRQVLAALVLAAVATPVPALLLGGGWLALEAAPLGLLAAYLLALVLLARRRHGATNPAPARIPRSLAAVPAAPE
ncbi:MAG TPA: hypothetical protein VF486_11100 [Actinomycetes bacterium]